MLILGACNRGLLYKRAERDTTFAEGVRKRTLEHDVYLTAWLADLSSCFQLDQARFFMS